MDCSGRVYLENNDEHSTLKRNYMIKYSGINLPFCERQHLLKSKDQKIVVNNKDHISQKDKQASFKTMTCLLEDTTNNFVIPSRGSRAEGVWVAREIA